MNNNQKTFENMKKSYQNRTMPKEEFLHMLVKMKEAERRNRIEARKKVAKISLPIAACLAVVFFVLPNTSKDIAYAMSKVPVISQIVEVATIREYDFEDENAEADIKVPEMSLSAASQDGEIAEKENIDMDLADEDVKSNLADSFSNINSQVSKISDKLVAEFKAGIKNKEGFQSVRVSYKVIDSNKDFFTLKLMCHQTGASAAEWDYYYTVNLRNGKIVTLDSILGDIEGYKEIVTTEIKKQMKDIMDQDETATFWALDEECLDEEHDLLTSETQFYINKDGELVICYDEGDVAPMCMGKVSFIIPTETIKPILN